MKYARLTMGRKAVLVGWTQRAGMWLLVLMFFCAPVAIAQALSQSHEIEWLQRARILPEPFVRVISIPERYHDRFITVSGYLRVERENCALYLNKESADMLWSENAIWLAFADTVYLSRSGPIGNYFAAGGDIVKSDRRYVTVQGRFDTTFASDDFRFVLRDVDMAAVQSTY